VHAYESAEQTINQTLELVRENADVIGETQALVVLGEVLIKRRPETAEAQLQTALKNARQHNQRVLVARTLLGLGRLNIAVGRTETAVPYLRRSLSIFKEADMPLWQDRVLDELRNLDDRLSDPAATGM
jgi:tetratricopeptide (TPR) repeat protein